MAAFRALRITTVPDVMILVEKNKNDPVQTINTVGSTRSERNKSGACCRSH